MKKLFLILLAITLLPACQPTVAPASPTPSVASTPIPTDTPVPTPTHTPAPPDPKTGATAFLNGWKEDDYEGMYGLLSPESQAAKTQEDFLNHFRGVLIEGAIQSIDYEILSVEQPSPSEAKVNYRLTFHSNLVPDWTDETSMNLVLQDMQWRVKWEDTIVMSSLGGENFLSMNREEYTPARGNIYDRNGNLLAGDSDAYSVGLNMSAFDPAFTEEFIGPLSRLSGLPAGAVEAMLKNAVENSTPYLSFGEYTAEDASSWEGTFNSLSGITWSTYHSRFYFGSPFFGSAPHVLGYVSQIHAEDLDAFRRQGFRKDELVGQNGLEKWGESYLLGQRGGELYVRDGNSNILKTLAKATAVPSQDITTTLTLPFQATVQRAMSGLTGAAVVLERDTGRVLAMVSSPTFDPNAFVPDNVNSYTELTNLSSSLQPLYNRATQGVYPLGSVFKIITMAAALESGRFTADSSYECGYVFTELPDTPLYDWTYEHFQEDGETEPSGHLTLPQGLIRSCNPFFYKIGMDLYQAGLTTAISDMARGFGLGSLTGIQGVTEQAGNVPDPVSVLDSTYLAIGQSELQVTPLQVASFVAAVGNGGKLYTPQVIEQIAPPGGAPSLMFKPEVRGTLPVKPENLALIQEAMKGVVSSNKPYGTAYFVFRGMQLPIYGKTGTAQTGVNPHAWFAAYTDARYPNLPDISVAVIVEHGGEGSEWAAPIARRIIELYFNGSASKLYPWESSINVWATPEPPEEEGQQCEEGDEDCEETDNGEGVPTPIGD